MYPVSRSEAKGEIVEMQTLLLFKSKLLCYRANWVLVYIIYLTYYVTNTSHAALDLHVRKIHDNGFIIS